MHELDRRSWLKLCLTTAGAAMLPTPPRLEADAGMQLARAIPSSGERVPAVGLGTYRTFDLGRSEQVLAPLKEVLHVFVERGGALVDSSPMYGRAERVVGDLASQLNIEDRLFFATKVWTRGRESGERQMEASFRLLATDRIDLMQVHNLVDTRTQLNTIRRLMEAGRVRYAGITHHTQSAFDELESWMRKEKLDYVQVPYSIARREAERRLLPAAAERGVAVITHRNFERGALFRKVKGKTLPDWAAEFDCGSWGNFFLKYLLADPRVTHVIPATAKVKHLEDNMNAGLGRLPDQALRRRMADYVDGL